MNQRNHKSSSWNPPIQQKISQFAPSPNTIQAQQDSHRPPTQEEIENEAFEQNKFEAFGLQLKEERGAIQPHEQERLGVLQAKMDDFRVQRWERGSRFDRNFVNIPVHSPGEQVSAPLQPYRVGDRLQSPQQSSEPASNGEMGSIQRAFPATSAPPIHPVPLFQAKFNIGQPGDKYEQEADRVASQVVKQISAPGSAKATLGQSVQRQEEAEKELHAKPSISHIQRSPLSPKVQREAMPEEEDLQAKSILQPQEAIAGGEASSDLESAINNARGGGQPLDAGLQQSMGQAMGADFSGVKVHTDAQSNQLNQSIQAKAFTTGQDVFFQQGAYQPGSRGGQELIAHELTHVVQQNGLVQRLTSENIIQRRMGIEAEMSIPAPVNGVAATANDRIRLFLGGSQNPGQNIQPLANGFEIETDHDQLGTEIEGARNAINANINQAVAGGAAARPPIALVTAGHKVPNVEYKSAPYNEEDPVNRQAFLTTVGLMAVDMAQKYQRARQEQFVVGGYRIGVPIEQDWLDFAVYNHLSAPFIQAVRNTILARVTPNLYMQVTAGILPKKIAKHLQVASGNLEVASLRGTIHHNADAMEALLTSGAVTTANLVLKQVVGLTSDQRSSKSLKGFLSLAISYLYGNYIYYQGNTVGKNLVPFLSKTPLNEIQLELDTNKRPDQMAPHVRTSMQNIIIANVLARVGQPDVQVFWPVGGNHNNGPLGNWQHTWLPKVLEGNNPAGADAFTNAQLAGRTIDPEDHARSKQITPGPGRTARNPANPNGTPDEYGGVIPLEFRHIADRINPADLIHFVRRMIDHVRAVNR
ncbi:MAG: DUF4157 domain-containing protein [Cyanomargarita calcarea GSE-NOS-MK-12-04C]|jgi:hypothetical protein|uniref:DUF4157 domain-containing protein n=1 Tax=Cyanomargarita calcarea GSE-NOS-MK-12-04C TaxID=2839659 RepID=A0A951UVT4_9CYAN|nr:DUF4157 domain-containing protein [Cyanomargarita calcarea GSE-NOS-MK-12-04C]